MWKNKKLVECGERRPGTRLYIRCDPKSYPGAALRWLRQHIKPKTLIFQRLQGTAYFNSRRGRTRFDIRPGQHRFFQHPGCHIWYREPTRELSFLVPDFTLLIW